MSDNKTNRDARDRPRSHWNLDYERSAPREPSGISEYEFAASLQEGASSFNKVREYIKHRKHPSR